MCTRTLYYSIIGMGKGVGICSSRSGALTKDTYTIRIAAKVSDIVMHPLNGRIYIQESEVLRRYVAN